MPRGAPAADSSPAWPAGNVPRIGVLQVCRSTDPLVGVTRQALRDGGYVEGKTIALEHRWAEGKAERLPALAADLVRLEVDAIMAFGDPAILAAQKTIRTIPPMIHGARLRTPRTMFTDRSFPPHRG